MCGLFISAVFSIHMLMPAIRPGLRLNAIQHSIRSLSVLSKRAIQR